MTAARLAIASAAIIGTLIAAIPEASAMPVAPIAAAPSAAQGGIVDVRFVHRRRGFHVGRFRPHRFHRWHHRRIFPRRIIRRVIRRAL